MPERLYVGLVDGFEFGLSLKIRIKQFTGRITHSYFPVLFLRY